MLNLTSSIENLPKIQKPQEAALKKLGILTVRDLLFYFPYRYLDFSRLVKIKDIKSHENITIQGNIKSIHGRFSFHGRIPLAEAIVSDDTGSLKVVWFNQAYLAKSLKKGEKIFLAGTPEYYKNSLQLTNPIYERISDFPVHTARLVPVYHLTQKIYPKTFRNLIANALPLTNQVKDDLPLSVLKSQHLINIQDAIRFSHFPKSLQQMVMAKKRLAFEEIFLNQLLGQKYKLEIAQKQSFAVAFNQPLTKHFVDQLPFKLTADQKKCAWQILKDLQKSMPMNRLLEGDVGSGKTLVALIAALQIIDNNLQVAFLAPTEILARQHYETAKNYLLPKEIANFDGRQNSQSSQSKSNLNVCLLTNQYSILNDENMPKNKLQALLTEGISGIYIGTHALLQKKVKFKNLALIIIDEQHRFGVEQRAHLMKSHGKVPHLLSLSATPIPRTLQLAFYGELDVSQIRTKPVGRKQIITKLIDQRNRGQAYEFITKQVLNGKQVFVITPLIEESDKLGVKAAKSELKNLQVIFPQFKIGLMHSRLKGNEKEKVMKEFLKNQTPILVSTSVVEVGVDVPNASVMVIEGAERFGLAQLHQFRGRVGRAEHQSYCFLFTQKEDDETRKRLEDFTKTQDGFTLSELDLKLRGFGELYGQAQWGWNFKYFDPAYTSLIEPARQEAQKILKGDLNLEKYPLLKGKIKDKIVHFE